MRAIKRVYPEEVDYCRNSDKNEPKPDEEKNLFVESKREHLHKRRSTSSLRTN